MKFVCDKCSTRYSIAEERVRGKILKIRCKNCGNVVTVREGMEVESVNRTGKATMAVPLVSPSALADSAPAPAALQQEWYVSIDGVQTGPLSLSAAQKWISGKPFNAELHCWNEGFDDWLPVEKVSHFRNLRKPPTTRPRAKTTPPPVPEKPLFAATMASLEKQGRAGGANGTGPIAARTSVPAAAKPSAPALPRPSTPGLPKPNAPALPRPSAPALPRPATPAAAATPPAAAGTPGVKSPTPIRGSSASALSARPGATANKVISSVGSKGGASAGAAALADAFGPDDASDALTAVGGASAFDDIPATNEPPAGRPPVDIKSMREALDDEDDGLSIGEVSRVVKLADLQPKPRPKSPSTSGGVQRLGTSGTGLPRAATAASASLTGAQPKLSPTELGMNVNPALATATGPGEAGPDESIVAASFAQRHRRGMIALIAVAGLLVAGVIGVVAWKVSQNPDEVGGGLGGVQQIDTSRPEDIIRRQQQATEGSGSGSAVHVTQTQTHRPHPINPNTGTQTHDDPGDDSLQAGEVEDMAAKQNEGTMRCYMRAQKGAMGFEIADVKKIAVTLGVNKEGAVTDVQLSSHGTDSFGQCLIARIKAWRFRASPSGGTFRISLAFGN